MGMAAHPAIAVPGKIGEAFNHFGTLIDHGHAVEVVGIGHDHVLSEAIHNRANTGVIHQGSERWSRRSA